MSSSLTLKDISFLDFPITIEDKEKLEKIFKTMEEDRLAIDFLEPVDYIQLGIADYPTIIKNPMDLGTAKLKLMDSEYKTFRDFLSDIDLIWKNCRTYNRSGSEICKMASHCEKHFRKLFDKAFKNYSVKKEIIKADNKQLTYSQKEEFVEKIRKLGEDGITEIVRLILNECKDAISDLSTEQKQIMVDNLDIGTYEKALKIIEKYSNKGEIKPNL